MAVLGRRKNSTRKMKSTKSDFMNGLTEFPAVGRNCKLEAATSPTSAINFAEDGLQATHQYFKIMNVFLAITFPAAGQNTFPLRAN